MKHYIEIGAEALSGRTLPFPFNTGVSFTPDQIVATAEHILAIPGWVPIGYVIALVQELLECADDGEATVVEHKDGTTEEHPADSAQAGVYARAAARLITAYELDITERSK